MRVPTSGGSAVAVIAGGSPGGGRTPGPKTGCATRVAAASLLLAAGCLEEPGRRTGRGGGGGATVRQVLGACVGRPSCAADPDCGDDLINEGIAGTCIMPGVPRTVCLGDTAAEGLETDLAEMACHGRTDCGHGDVCARHDVGSCLSSPPCDTDGDCDAWRRFQGVPQTCVPWTMPAWMCASACDLDGDCPDVTECRPWTEDGSDRRP